MRAFIFSGPTLPVAVIKSQTFKSVIHVFESIKVIPDNTDNLENMICFLPPVSEGEIYTIAQYKPGIIGIVDGFFENVPSVWHKEMLYTMSQGIYLYGAASMGALRAAELHTFGMRGCGSIFSAYFNRMLEDDDEVTVSHAPAEMGYMPLSEAMVNIRRTLDDARKANAVDGQHYDFIINTAKSLYYKDRTYARIFATIEASGASYNRHMIDALKVWIGDGGRKDQKREDALLMAHEIDRMILNPLALMKPSFNFEDTLIWKKAAGLISNA